MRLAVENIGIGGNLRIELLLDIRLVGDLAHDLLEDILQGDQTERRTVLVDNDGNVDFLGLELLEQAVDLLVFRHEIGLAAKVRPAEIVRGGNIRQHILYIENTSHIVQVFLVNRNTRIARLHDHLLDPCEVLRFVERDHLDPRAHDLPYFRIDELDDTRKDFLLLDGLVRSHLDRIRKLVHRDIDLFLRHAAINQTPRTDQQVRYRTEQRTEKPERHRHQPDDTQRVIGGENFRHDLAEEQQQESNDHHFHGKFQSRGTAEIDPRIDQRVRQDHDADID